MTAAPASAPVPRPADGYWPRSDGSALDCRDKLRVLAENQAELEQVLRDCFDDAVLMGVDDRAMRALLHALVDGLRGPHA